MKIARASSILQSFALLLSGLVLASAPSQVAEAAVASMVPSPVSGVRVSALSSSSVVVSWGVPSGNGSVVSDYRVEFSDNGRDWVVFDDGVSAVASAVVSGLVRGTPYVFRVSARNASGWGVAGMASGMVSLVSGGGDHTCAVTAAGAVKCWGYGRYGQLNYQSCPWCWDTGDKSAPVVAKLSSPVSLALGYDFGCAVLSDGAVWCWGRGSGGQLGNGSNADSAQIVQVSGIAAPVGAVSVAAGGNFACAVLSDGTVWCWGANDYGQLGDGSVNASSVPVQVRGLSGVQSVAAGRDFACAVLSSGSVRCWGRNDSGQLGNGDTKARNVTTAVLGVSSPVSLAAGDDAACAALPDGSVKCWGANSGGATPAAVVGVDGAFKVAVGGRTLCAVLVDGTLKCWGSNTTGQLANGSWENSNWTPSTWGGLSSVRDVAIGSGHVCAATADNTVFCAGRNDHGQLGSGAAGRTMCYARDNWNNCTGSGLGLETARQATGFTALDLQFTAQVAPDAPTSMRYQDRSSSQITLVWAAPTEDGASPITGYLIRQSSDGGQTWQVVPDSRITRASATARTAQITGLSAGVSYMFQAAAVNAMGTGAWSASSVQALAASNPDKATSVFATAVTATTASLAWAAPSGNGADITGYLIESSTDNGKTWAQVPAQRIIQTSPIDTAATITGLTRGTAYLIRIAATNSQGTGAFTTIGAQIIPSVAPGAPTNLATGARTMTTATITWNAPADDGGRPITAYAIQYSTDNAATWRDADLGWITMASPTATTATIAGLTTGTTYLFRVRAINPNGPSDWATYVSALAAVAPGAIASISTTGSTGTTASVQWSLPLVNGAPIQRYEFQSSLDGGTSWMAVDQSAISIDSPQAFSATIRSLVRGAAYRFRVRAVNSEGVSPWSPASSSVTPAEAPSAPTDALVVLRTANSMTLQFQVPSDDGGLPISNYNLQYGLRGSGQWIAATRVTKISENDSPGTVTLLIDGLTAGSAYQFRVQATNGREAGAWSAVTQQAIAAQPPAQVSNLGLPLDPFDQTPALEADRINLKWTAPSANGSAVSGYVIQISADGLNWGNSIPLAAGLTSYTITSLQPAQARLVRIAAVNGEGQGPWSDSLVVLTEGMVSSRVIVVDASGLPVMGGAITWRMDDGSAKSSITYGLTADGVIQFPAVPAGYVTFTVKNALMQNGTYVSGTWHQVLGYATNVLRLPPEPQSPVHTVRVRLKGGPLLNNVRVTLNNFGRLRDTLTAGGFTFITPVQPEGAQSAGGAITGYTDSSGEFSVRGYLDNEPYVNVSYDDGVISQSRSGQSSGPVTDISLKSMPFATFATGSVTGNVGAPTAVVVTAGSGVTALRRAAGLGGVQVTLVAPAGATKCTKNGAKQILSARTGESGQATLVVCPLKSGTYTLVTKGALAVGAVNVFARGAAPFAVNSVTVASPKVGQLHASWGKPIFDGGSPVRSYEVTATATGKKAVTTVLSAKLDSKGKVLKAAPMVLDLKGLANATVYRVSIVAVNSAGRSDPYTIAVPVA